MNIKTLLKGWIILLSMMFVVYLILQFKYDLFSLPYFWDELGVYSKSSIHLFIHGLGLLPSNLPDELSRGHPLLVPFIWGLGFKVAGYQIVVARIIGALIYSIGMLYLYLIFTQRFSAFKSVVFTFIIFIQPCFIAQSVLILPEIPLMTSTIIAFYYFIKQKYFGLSIALTLALFIKESALFLPLVFYFIDYLTEKFKFKNFISILIIPFAFIVGFFIIQHIQRGYYFYPLHTSLLKLEMYFIKERYGVLSDFIFYDQGRIVLWFIAPLLFILFKVYSIYKKNSEMIFFKYNKSDFRFYLSAVLIILGGISFSVINYYLSRYSMYFLVFAFLLFFTLFFSTNNWNVLHYITLATVIILAPFYYDSKVYTDVNFSYVDHIKSSQKAIDYLNKPEFKDKQIAFEFPLAVATWDHYSGYFDTLKFKTMLFDDTANVQYDYYVFTHPGNYYNLSNYQSKITLFKRIENGNAFVEIYKRKD